jgi:hypothetical protein
MLYEGIQLYMDMIKMIVVTIWNETQGNAIDEGIQLYMDMIKMIVLTQGYAMLWLYGMLDEGIQFYMDIMWNERGGNAMQWLKGMHPVGIPWHMNMMCNQLYIVTITPWHIIWCAINYI